MTDPANFGRYVVEGVIGKGAMGVVYLARDPVIGRRLALKTLRVPDDGEEAEEFRARFLREAQAVGILNHPGVVTVHDAGVDETSGLSYIAMEFIEGKTLKEMLKGGHMFAYSEVARIGACLAGALDYAHAKGVVHRDIKPANIILTPQGGVKITDFGVARLESSNLTATGQFIGTPNYMSPEQVTGAAIDGRSDLFSLGVVLFELLTGGRPFLASSLTEVSYKIVHEAAPIPSQARAGLPPAFNPIVLKLLEKEPAKRYQRGADVARALDALRRVLAGMAGEVTQYIQPTAAAGAEAQAAAVHSAPTATRATVVADTPVAGAASGSPTVWRLPIQSRWVAPLIGAVLLPVLALIVILWLRVDRGPYDGPPPGEPERRHRIALAQRQAAAELAAGRPEEAERLLRQVWDQAPHSTRARELARRAEALKASMAEVREREARVARLKEEGTRLVREGRWRDAAGRFEEAARLAPADPLLREYVDFVRERLRSPASERREPVVPAVAVATTPAPTGRATLQVYFNSPLAAGTVELEVDGQALSSKSFDFYKPGFLGMRRKDTGLHDDQLAVPSGSHRLLVRLRDEEGKVRGEQTLDASFAANGLYVLKIVMESARVAPEFSLNQVRGR